MGKVIRLEELLKIREQLRSESKKIVFTNGVFDLIHAGHLRFLKKVKAHGDVLVVGMNSDDSVRKIKGPKRPIIGQAYRAEMLSSLPMVDYVVIFSDTTPEKTIAALKPDVHVKGGDWKPEQLPEAKIVKSYGGMVVIENSECELTTTSLIKKVLEAYGQG